MIPTQIKLFPVSCMVHVDMFLPVWCVHLNRRSKWDDDCESDAIVINAND